MALAGNLDGWLAQLATLIFALYDKPFDSQTPEPSSATLLAVGLICGAGLKASDALASAQNPALTQRSRISRSLGATYGYCDGHSITPVDSGDQIGPRAQTSDGRRSMQTCRSEG